MGDRQSIIVTDLGFGDAGKGTVVDYLARKGKVAAVVRFNGGAQARHSVVTPDGRHHAFSQFGSGSFVPGVRTHLSRFMLFDPEQMLTEAKELIEHGITSPFARLSVDEDAMVVTPYHRAANMAREESRGNGRHGTCGHGIGETMAHSIAHPEEVIRAGDLRHSVRLRCLLELARERFCEEFRFDESLLERYFSSIDMERWLSLVTPSFLVERIVTGDRLKQLAREGHLIFEGAQGVLLDEWYGFHPHTTWSTTTSANAITLLEEIGYGGSVTRMGVLRTYMTRHGQGPFVTEDDSLSLVLPEPHNGTDGWQGEFRRGWFDTVMSRYALSVSGGVDSLAITHVDRLASLPDLKVGTSYRFRTYGLSVQERLMLTMVQEKDETVLAGGLKPKTDLMNLSYQEDLTGILKKAEPVYNIYKDQERFLSAIEGELNTPISMVSQGPTFVDKMLRG